ncbi:MAG: helix-turn-helix transcriptional regulator [Cyanobacteria bacterium P01_A01_bin.45]
MTSVYTLNLPGNSTVELSQDELRSVLGNIEAELHNSKVYRRAIANLQKLLGSSSEQAKVLFKAVGREAIGLAFRQFMLQKKNIADTQAEAAAAPPVEPTPETNIETASEVNTQNGADLSNYLTNVTNNSPSTLNSASTLNPIAGAIVKASSNTELTKQTKSSQNPLKNLFSFNKKASKAELEQQMLLQQKTETLQKIGQELKQAREARGMSLDDLRPYTHVPLHKMEALERGDWDSLPEEIYVRGFIRVMGNALGMNGTSLAASLPISEKTELLLPECYQNSKDSSPGFGLEVRPIHLYVGYTAFVAGAIGGLSFMSHQAETNKVVDTDKEGASSSLTKLRQEEELSAKPGLKSNANGIVVGSDIAPPEAV